MLDPDSRSHLMELLRPPPGCRFDRAIGTTYSLDLMSALVLPLSFVFFDWESENEEPFDPLALLEALRLNGDKFSIFCQAGNIRLPDKYSPLVTFLEPCIHEVVAPSAHGVFHPKVWVVRYLADDGGVHYRVLCLSRNLTFDRSWDTVVALDGVLTNRTRSFKNNRPLADLVEALPKLCLHPMSPARRKDVRMMAGELPLVQFTWPEGFDPAQCRFWLGGLDGKRLAPFGDRRGKSLIVSPFVSDAVIRDYLDTGNETHLVSRPESFQDLSADTLKACTSLSFLHPQLTEENAEDRQTHVADEVLDGLHAKLFVIDRGREASVFSGSFNATNHALGHNVEFMVEMVGKRTQVGVDHFLAEEKGKTRFASLLQKFDPVGPLVPPDSLREKFDELFRVAKRAVIDARPELVVTRAPEPGLFHLSLRWTKGLDIDTIPVQVKVWPITLPATRAAALSEDIRFAALSIEAITPLLAISLTATVDGTKRESCFVMNLPLTGAPDDRHDRVVAGMLKGKEQLLRYILFLLAAGDPETAASGELVKLLHHSGLTSEQSTAMPTMLETMLRALHRGPQQIARVAALLDSLRRCGQESVLTDSGFDAVWSPIWDAARIALSRK